MTKKPISITNIYSNYVKKHITTSTIALIVIIFIYLILVLWGIDYGLPQIFNFDENFIVKNAIEVGSGNLNYDFYEWPGALQIHLLGIIFAGLNFFHHFFMSSNITLSEWFFTNPTLFYQLSRYLTVLFGIGSIVIIYLLGKSIKNKNLGLIAALLTVLTFAFGRHSHYATPDIPLTFFILLTLLASLKILETKKSSYFIMGGIAAGLAASCKYYGILAWGTVVLATLFIIYPNKDKWSKYIKRLTSSFILIFISFIIVNPSFLFNTNKAIADIASVSNPDHVGRSGTFLLNRFEFYYTSALPNSISFIALLITSIAIIYFLVKNKKSAWILFSFIILFNLFLATFESQWERYVLPLIPVAIIFLVWFILNIGEKLIKRKVILRYVLTAIILFFLILPGFTRLIITDITLASKEKDSRHVSHQWIIENIPAGTKIAQENQTPELIRDDYLVEKNQYLSNKTIEYYKDNNFEYLIASKEMYSRFSGKSKYKEEQEYYKKLFKNHTEVYQIGGNDGKIKEMILVNDYELVVWFFSNMKSIFELEPGPLIRIIKI